MVREFNDYELLYMIIQCDENALNYLVEKYKKVIWRIITSATNKYQPKGVEKEDLFQEGLIALMDALSSFRDDIRAPFFSFALICIERQVKGYIRRFNSLTTRLNYNALSLDMYVSEDESLYLRDVIPANQQNISYITLFQDDLLALIDQENSILTNIEKQILSLKVEGYSYYEIGEKLDISTKHVDNCIQAVKRKTRNSY